MSLKFKPEKILVYVEASKESIIAAQYAVCMARWLGASLSAVYVVDVKTLEDLIKANIFVKMEEMDYEHDLEEDGKRYLNHVSELAAAKGVRIETSLLRGEVYSSVINKMEHDNIDLLVMGELDEPESRRDFYYNESERIFRKSPCPVLIVKEHDDIKTLYEHL
ncbi:universal stress protein [bacterium]|nr:universal stress protein [bacterium]